MKKSIRKTVRYLRRYIGHEIIRTKPANEENFFTSGAPILLVGFTKDGCIRYRYTGIATEIFGNKEFTLDNCYTDRNWITYKKAVRPKHNVLNNWRGKKIKRIRPTIYNDVNFMLGEPPTLISASKYHMQIQYNDTGRKGKKFVLGSIYIKPKDWVLAE